MQSRLLAIVGVMTIALTGAIAQPTTEPVSSRDPDPLHFLQTVARRGLQPYYHVEVEIQEERTTEYLESQRRSVVTAIVAPNHRYRYETRGDGFSWLQISDGSTEWTYDREHNRYMQQRVSNDSPLEFHDQWGYEQDQLNDTHAVLKDLAERAGRDFSL